MEDVSEEQREEMASAEDSFNAYVLSLLEGLTGISPLWLHGWHMPCRTEPSNTRTLTHERLPCTVGHNLFALLWCRDADWQILQA